MAAAAPTIAARANQLQCAFDATEFGNRPDFHQHGQTLLQINRRLVGWVGTDFGFCLAVVKAFELTRRSARRRVNSAHNSVF